MAPKQDMVNHPPHYNAGEVEVIDIIEQIVSTYDSVPGYCVGQIIKYLARAPLKGTYDQDLEKAQWYLNRLVNKL